MVKQKQIMVGLGLLVNDSGKILISLRNDPQSKTEDRKWEIPGGKVEFGETIEETIKREMKEELGVSITFLNYPPLIKSHVWKHPDIHVQVFLIGFLCKTDGVPKPNNEEVADVKWIKPSEINSYNFLPHCDYFVKKAGNYSSSK